MKPALKRLPLCDTVSAVQKANWSLQELICVSCREGKVSQEYNLQKLWKLETIWFGTII